MSGPFDELAIPASGMTTYKTWIDAISDNIANMNTARPTSEPAFQERYVVAKSSAVGADGIGTGVQVAGVAYGDPQGRLVYEPQNPLAGADGYVRYPDIDLSSQMSNLLVAQRAYQLNISVLDRARDAYQQALSIGKP
jgi:flagellar basal-body rod protein FlgC